VSLLVALSPLAGTGGAQPSRAPLTRPQALAGLGSPDATTRREAAASLGEVGTTADAPALLDALRDQDEVVRALAEHSVWQVWSRSGDREIDALFEVGLDQMNRRDAGGAIDTFTDIIRRKPDFAEGWNKRATLYFLVGDYTRSLADCDEVMKRNPTHFGALAGYGQIYLQLDQPERALQYFERALDVNPNLTGVEAAVRELRRALIERRKGTI
jgi:tetratricopeptide (TPR) repeat protein